MHPTADYSSGLTIMTTAQGSLSCTMLSCLPADYSSGLTIIHHHDAVMCTSLRGSNHEGDQLERGTCQAMVEDTKYELLADLAMPDTGLAIT
jgi:hypothetical protein